MQIQFKQAEIVAALKQYIASQGINVSGKTVDIAFSATRGAAGIIADVTIEDASIPGFSDSAVEDNAKPALTVVQPVTAAIATPATEAAAAEPMAKAQVEASEPEPEAAPAKTTSLFN